MPDTHATAGRREWIALAVLVLPLLLVSMDITVLFFAVPEIAASLGPSSTQQLWMVDVYGFVLAGMLITMGNIGDLVGRRRLLLIGSTIFGVASVIAAFSTSPEMLIVARAAQGLGGATLMPSTLALVRNMFHDERQRRAAIAVWSIGLSAGAAIGPVVSGALLNNFWWGSIFLVNVPVLVLLLVLGPMLVPEFRQKSEGRFDLLSALLSLVAVLSVIWGLKELATHGFEPVQAVVVVAGLALGAGFLYRQAHLAHPMVDPRLFRSRGFGPAVTVNLAAFFCLIGFGIFTTQYLLSVLHMSPLEAALWTMASPVLTFLVVPFAVMLTRVVRPAYVISSGFLFAAAGFILMTQVTTERNLPLVVAGTVGIGVGAAIVLTMITDMVVTVAPAEKVGSVSALNQTFQELGGALGIAIFGSIGASVYADGVQTSAPDSVPQAAVDAADETLGGAATAARQLSEVDAGALLNSAYEAYVDAFGAAATVGACVAAIAIVFTVSRLRHVASTQPAAGDAPETREEEPAPAR